MSNKSQSNALVRINRYALDINEFYDNLDYDKFEFIICGTEQFWAPKLGARQLPDGSMVSPSLEDMSPFLSAEELAASRFVDEAGADGTDL